MITLCLKKKVISLLYIIFSIILEKQVSIDIGQYLFVSLQSFLKIGTTFAILQLLGNIPLLKIKFVKYFKMWSDYIS